MKQKKMLRTSINILDLRMTEENAPVCAESVGLSPLRSPPATQRAPCHVTSSSGGSIGGATRLMSLFLIVLVLGVNSTQARSARFLEEEDDVEVTFPNATLLQDCSNWKNFFTQALTSFNLTGLGAAADALKNLATKISTEEKLHISAPIHGSQADVKKEYLKISQDLLMPARRIEDRINTFFSHADHKREKRQATEHHHDERSLNIIGEAWSFFGGNPSPTDKLRYETSLKLFQLRGEAQEDFNNHTVQEQKLLHRALQLENEALVNFTSAINTTMKILNKEEDNDVALLNFNVLKAAYDSLRFQIEDILERAEKIFSRGLDGRLHPLALMKSKLVELLVKIETDEQHRTTAPLYSSRKAHLYYTTNHLAKVYLHEGILHVSVRIPMVNFRDSGVIHPLTKKQKDESRFDIYGFDFVVTNRQLGYHHLLRQEELDWCIKIRQLGRLDYVCYSRKSKIFNRVGQIGDFVVNDLSPTEYLVKAKYNMTGNLDCGSGEESVSVGDSCLIRVRTRCSLWTNAFSIPKRGKHQIDEPIEDFEIERDREELKLLEKPDHPIPGLPNLIHDEVQDIIRQAKNETAAEDKVNSYISSLDEKLKHILEATGYGATPFLLVVFIALSIWACCTCKKEVM